MAGAAGAAASLIAARCRRARRGSSRKEERQTARSLEGLLALQRVTAIVGGHLSLKRAIKAIVEELGRTFGHRLISVNLRTGDVLILQAQVGYASPYTAIPLGMGVCGRCVEIGETIFLPEVRTDPSYLPAADGPVVSEICVPLRDAAWTTGVLNVESVVAPLTDLDCELLELLAAQVAVVLRNARLTEDLRRQAELDPLTGLPNRGAALAGLDHALTLPDARCALLLIDIDNLKGANDTHGHLEGDAMLRHVADILRSACRQGDLAGRYGGDEFVVVLPEARRVDAEAVATRVEDALRGSPYQTAVGCVVPLSASIGIAAAPDDGGNGRDLVDIADAAMYARKGAGYRFAAPRNL